VISGSCGSSTCTMLSGRETFERNVSKHDKALVKKSAPIGKRVHFSVFIDSCLRNVSRVVKIQFVLVKFGFSRSNTTKNRSIIHYWAKFQEKMLCAWCESSFNAFQYTQVRASTVRASHHNTAASYLNTSHTKTIISKGTETFWCI